MIKTIKGTELATKTLEVLEDGTLRIIETGKYIPSKDEVYYFYDYFLDCVEHYCFDGDDTDIRIINNTLVFSTKEECEQYKQYLDLLDCYTIKPDFKDVKQEKCFMSYNHILGKIVVIEATGNGSVQLGTRYFSSKDIAIDFLEQVGEIAIKCFMFDIWE